eukprot:6918398-Pyramimonas_sp.AAC.1
MLGAAGCVEEAVGPDGGSGFLGLLCGSGFGAWWPRSGSSPRRARDWGLRRSSACQSRRQLALVQAVGRSLEDAGAHAAAP